LKGLSRVPFSKEKIINMRLVADGGDNTFDCGIGNLKFRAAAIAGGLPKDELGTGPNWLRIVCLVVLASGVGFFVQEWRHRRRNEESPVPRRKSASCSAGSPSPMARQGTSRAIARSRGDRSSRRSCENSTGLVRWWLKPASRDRARSSS
jgi:hypothetical protein